MLLLLLLLPPPALHPVLALLLFHAPQPLEQQQQRRAPRAQAEGAQRRAARHPQALQALPRRQVGAIVVAVAVAITVVMGPAAAADVAVTAVKSLVTCPRQPPGSGTSTAAPPYVIIMARRCSSFCECDSCHYRTVAPRNTVVLAVVGTTTTTTFSAACSPFERR